MIGVERPFLLDKKDNKNMDTINVIGQLITSLGFPIVAAGALFWYVNKKDKDHKEEINSLRQSLDRNTSILEELKTLINIFSEELKK